MTLSFGGITIGGGPYYYLDRNMEGLDGSVEHVDIKVPRTDYSTDVSNYLAPKIRKFTGVIAGSNRADMRTKKRALANMLRNEYTFTLTDSYMESGAMTTFAEYEFTGKIIDFQVNDDFHADYSRFMIQIFCEDPFLYSTTAVTDTCEVHTRGFYFPLIFPFVFTGRDNVMTVNNTGLVDVYPTITIHGSGYNFEIINETYDGDDKVFKYNGTLNSVQELVLTPTPTDPIKARVSGVSVIGLTNSNFEALVIKPGSNTLTFFLESGEDSFTEASISFKPAWVGI